MFRLLTNPEPPLAALMVQVVLASGPMRVLFADLLPWTRVIPLKPPGAPPAICGAAPVCKLMVMGPISLT
jgi:hypothetical protein